MNINIYVHFNTKKDKHKFTLAFRSQNQLHLKQRVVNQIQILSSKPYFLFF